MTEAGIQALRRRYARSATSASGPTGTIKYLELKGQFSAFLQDPYTPRAEREPKRDHVTVALVGGGFAGMVTGARLKETGICGVRIVEKGGGFGGTVLEPVPLQNVATILTCGFTESLTGAPSLTRPGGTR